MAAEATAGRFRPAARLPGSPLPGVGPGGVAGRGADRGAVRGLRGPAAADPGLPAGRLRRGRDGGGPGLPGGRLRGGPAPARQPDRLAAAGLVAADAGGRRGAAVLGAGLPDSSRDAALRAGGGDAGVRGVRDRGAGRADRAAVPGQPVPAAALALAAVGVPGRLGHVHRHPGRRAGAGHRAASAAHRAVRGPAGGARRGRDPRSAGLDRRRADPGLLGDHHGPPGDQVPAVDREPAAAAEVADRRGGVLRGGHRDHDLRRELLLRRPPRPSRTPPTSGRPRCRPRSAWGS